MREDNTNYDFPYTLDATNNQGESIITLELVGRVSQTSTIEITIMDSNNVSDSVTVKVYD